MGTDLLRLAPFTFCIRGFLLPIRNTFVRISIVFVTLVIVYNPYKH